MDVGIRKDRSLINIALGINAIVFILLCAIMWGVYQANYENEYWINNGIEVEAECYDWVSTIEDDMHHVVYYCRYHYVNEDGKEYIAAVRFTNKKAAQAEIGNKIIITINPNSLTVRNGSLKSLKLHYKRDFILAIIFCFPVPIVLYLFMYRSIYRSILNYKIRKMLGEEGDKFIGNPNYHKELITTGEVVKVRKWIVGYVKVSYRDEYGENQEKWARYWFTRREAKFLEQKRFINIIPYKNTYGILEKNAD